MEQEFVTAVLDGNIPRVRELLLREANAQSYGERVFLFASQNGRKDIVRVLLDAGINIHVHDDELVAVASKHGHTEIVRMLLDAGADVHIRNDVSLRWSAHNGHTETVKVLLDANADVHADNDQALRYATRNGHIETVKVLLDAGADMHADHDYARVRAVIYGHPEIVRLLDTYQPDEPDSVIDDFGATNLMIVAQNGPTYKLREYLTRTRNIDKQDIDGNTALIYAVHSNEPLRIQALLENRASPFIANYAISDMTGANAWDYAQGNNNPQIRDLFSPFDNEGQLHLIMIERNIPRDIRTIVQQYR